MNYSKIQKVRIPKDSLPPIEAGGAYYVRFRIRSSDNNMKSHWSWVFVVVDAIGKENVLDGGEIV